MRKPVVFVGSASEHLEVLKHLDGLGSTSRVHYIPYTNLEVFRPSEYTVPSLCKFFETIDGAAFMSLSVDRTWWRGKTVFSPRDNVIFEAGLAIGYLGAGRTALVTDSKAKLPSDLHGITTIRYQRTGHLDRDVRELHAQLESFFAKIKCRQRVVSGLWGENEYQIFFHSFDNPEKGEFEEIVNFNAVRSTVFLTEMFGRRGIRYSLHSSRLEEPNLESNLVLLGSSASNRLSKDLLASHARDWRFSFDFHPKTKTQRGVVDRHSGKRFESLLSRGGGLSRDYGVLTKCRNPYNRDRWVIMAAGNYGFGTLGALRAVLDEDGGDLSLLPVDVEREFQLVVEVPVTGRFSCGRPRVVANAQIKSKRTIQLLPRA